MENPHQTVFRIDMSDRQDEVRLLQCSATGEHSARAPRDFQFPLQSIGILKIHAVFKEHEKILNVPKVHRSRNADLDKPRGLRCESGQIVHAGGQWKILVKAAGHQVVVLRPQVRNRKIFFAMHLNDILSLRRAGVGHEMLCFILALAIPFREIFRFNLALADA